MITASEEKAITTVSVSAELVEKVVLEGDLSRLSAGERVAYYRNVCQSLGLNPLTRPFEYIVLNKKLTLYARKDAAEQLRRIHGVSVEKLEKDFSPDGENYVVTAYGKDSKGRTDVATGAVHLKGMEGEVRANAIMKAETKAKRRLTLSIVGLGWLDETEIESIPDREIVTVDQDTGEVLDQRPAIAPPVVASPKGSNVTRIELKGQSEPGAKKPWKRYELEINGMTYSCFDEAVVKTCQDAQEQGLRVKIVRTQAPRDPKFKSLNVTEVVLLPPPEAPGEELVLDSESPA